MVMQTAETAETLTAATVTAILTAAKTPVDINLVTCVSHILLNTFFFKSGYMYNFVFIRKGMVGHIACLRYSQVVELSRTRSLKKGM
jgi:hypothetical protein